MRDYVRELTDAWAKEGEQAAYLLIDRLHRDIRSDIARLQKQGAAIQALAAVLKDHPDVDTSMDPVEPENGLDVIEPALRSRFITEAAESIIAEREDMLRYDREIGAYEVGVRFPDEGVIPKVQPQDVVNRFEAQGLTLSVQQPMALIGTVLANAEGFERIARNTFVKHKKERVPTEPDDLPF